MEDEQGERRRPGRMPKVAKVLLPTSDDRRKIEFGYRADSMIIRGSAEGDQILVHLAEDDPELIAEPALIKVTGGTRNNPLPLTTVTDVVSGSIPSTSWTAEAKSLS